MNKDNLVMAAVVIALVFSSVAIFGGGIGPKGDRGDRGDRGLGGASGPTHTNTQYFYTGFTVGHDVTATSSTEATFTLTNQFVDSDIPFVSWNSGLDNTLTFQASTSAPFNNLRPGESFSQIWHSATTTAATTITFAAGTGIVLQDDEDSADLVVLGNDTAVFTYLKLENTDILVLFTEFTDAD